MSKCIVVSLAGTVIIKLPLNSGQIWESAPIGPLLVNWPTASSIYSNGIPHIMRMRKYGTKNTPETLNFF